jgi:dolichyl-phosphate beta-glucosyltransferase
MINSLSIILPFYNEEKRLGQTFREIIKFSKKNKIKFKEFIFVDDGSFDNSHKIVKNFIGKNKLRYSKFRLIKLKKNLGKGAAIKNGVKVSKGKWILTSDIDFSVSLFEIEKWQKKNYLQQNKQVYFGSRSHGKSKVKSKFYRKIIGNFLRFLISIILRINISDTQCGFKLYKKSTAKQLFSRIKFLGYEHDIEIVILLKKNKIHITELPVTWFHVPQSKVNIIFDSCKIFIKIFFMKLKY